MVFVGGYFDCLLVVGGGGGLLEECVEWNGGVVGVIGVVLVVIVGVVVVGVFVVVWGWCGFVDDGMLNLVMVVWWYVVLVV